MSWQEAVDVGVWVCLKMCGQFGLGLADLAVELDDDSYRCAGGRGGHWGGSGELFGAQHPDDLLSWDVDVVLTPSAFES